MERLVDFPDILAHHVFTCFHIKELFVLSQVSVSFNDLIFNDEHEYSNVIFKHLMIRTLMTDSLQSSSAATTTTSETTDDYETLAVKIEREKPENVTWKSYFQEQYNQWVFDPECNEEPDAVFNSRYRVLQCLKTWTSGICKKKMTFGSVYRFKFEIVQYIPGSNSYEVILGITTHNKQTMSKFKQDEGSSVFSQETKGLGINLGAWSTRTDSTNVQITTSDTRAPFKAGDVIGFVFDFRTTTLSLDVHFNGTKIATVDGTTLHADESTIFYATASLCTQKSVQMGPWHP